MIVPSEEEYVAFVEGSQNFRMADRDGLLVSQNRSLGEDHVVAFAEAEWVWEKFAHSDFWTRNIE